MSGPTLVRTEAQSASWTQIPNALRKLWRSCLPDLEGGDVARALTVNFVGVATIDEADVLREVTERLLRRTPCRAFLLLLDPTATDNQAELAATTRCQGDLRDIVLEAITLRLTPTALDQMPGLVRPLLVNDLTTHLFWATAWPQQTASLDALAKLCEHVVVDSRRFVEPPSDLQRLHERRAQATRPRLTDLTWLRLRPWRRALAESFERFAWQPGQPTSARIRHGKRGTAAAVLLGEWLQGRLGAAITLDGSGNAEAGGPESVMLESQPAGAGAVQLELTARGGQVVCHVTTAAHCFLPFSVAVSKGSDGDLLAAAIDMD